jgi:hypothetical protein
MSEYQSTPYGAGYGARDQTNPPYLPPTYPNQYLQGEDGRTGHMGANYDTSMGAYSYNRAIPGFSAAAVASGVPPLPIYQGWNQDAMPLPPYTAPHNPSPYPTGYGGAPQVNPQYYQPMAQQTYTPNTAVVKPYEQTDLSDGEFEDVGASANTPPIGYGSNNYHGSDGTGYMDSAQRAVYSRAQDYSPQSGYQGKDGSDYAVFTLTYTLQQTITIPSMPLPRIDVNNQTPIRRMFHLVELTTMSKQKELKLAMHMHPTRVKILLLGHNKVSMNGRRMVQPIDPNKALMQTDTILCTSRIVAFKSRLLVNKPSARLLV